MLLGLPTRCRLSFFTFSDLESGNQQLLALIVHGYLNDADFNFCHKCGFRRFFFSVSQHPSNRFTIDFQAIDDRLIHVVEAKTNNSWFSSVM